jgi:hypothetical protein
MNNYKEIERLIQKYFEGETSSDQDKQLQEFFKAGDVPANLKAHQAWFSQLKLRSETTWDGFSEDKLFGKLDNQLKEKSKVIPITKATNYGVWFYRVAAAVALILVGFYAGNQLRNGDVDNMKAELAEVKSMMLSQMNSSSPSGRLQAVNYSYRFSEVDDETLEALITVLETDSNMNVRLKAVEALSRFVTEERTKKALINALSTEKEPMVQIALIEVLVSNNVKSAVDDLERITQDKSSLKGVKDEAYMGMFKLKEL